MNKFWVVFRRRSDQLYRNVYGPYNKASVTPHNIRDMVKNINALDKNKDYYIVISKNPGRQIGNI
jgi:hypothetical protein